MLQNSSPKYCRGVNICATHIIAFKIVLPVPSQDCLYVLLLFPLVSINLEEMYRNNVIVYVSLSLVSGPLKADVDVVEMDNPLFF